MYSTPENQKIRDEICQMIREERTRQLEKWGDQEQTLFVWNLILQEELGEAAKAILEDHDKALVIAELVQVTAVAVQIAEHFLNAPKAGEESKTDFLLNKHLAMIMKSGSPQMSFLRLCEAVGKWADVIITNQWDMTSYNFLANIIAKGATTIKDVLTEKQ